MRSLTTPTNPCAIVSVVLYNICIAWEMGKSMTLIATQITIWNIRFWNVQSANNAGWKLIPRGYCHLLTSLANIGFSPFVAWSTTLWTTECAVNCTRVTCDRLFTLGTPTLHLFERSATLYNRLVCLVSGTTGRRWEMAPERLIAISLHRALRELCTGVGWYVVPIAIWVDFVSLLTLHKQLSNSIDHPNE